MLLEEKRRDFDVQQEALSDARVSLLFIFIFSVERTGLNNFFTTLSICKLIGVSFTLYVTTNQLFVVDDHFLKDFQTLTALSQVYRYRHIYSECTARTEKCLV